MPVVAGGPARLAGQLTAAETVLAEGDAPPALMARQALIVQLACLRVAAHPGWAGGWFGSALLRLHRHLAGDPWTVRWPHAPDWLAKNRFAGARV